MVLPKGLKIVMEEIVVNTRGLNAEQMWAVMLISRMTIECVWAQAKHYTTVCVLGAKHGFVQSVDCPVQSVDPPQWSPVW